MPRQIVLWSSNSHKFANSFSVTNTLPYACQVKDDPHPKLSYWYIKSQTYTLNMKPGHNMYYFTRIYSQFEDQTTWIVVFYVYVWDYGYCYLVTEG